MKHIKKFNEDLESGQTMIYFLYLLLYLVRIKD